MIPVHILPPTLSREVGIVQWVLRLGYGLDDRRIAVRLQAEAWRSDRMWGPPGLLSNGYRGLSQLEPYLQVFLIRREDV
jgi:hypothetical protein